MLDVTIPAICTALVFGAYAFWRERRHRRKRNEELRTRGYGFLIDPEDDK